MNKQHWASSEQSSAWNEKKKILKELRSPVIKVSIVVSEKSNSVERRLKEKLSDWKRPDGQMNSTVPEMISLEP